MSLAFLRAEMTRVRSSLRRDFENSLERRLYAFPSPRSCWSNQMVMLMGCLLLVFILGEIQTFLVSIFSVVMSFMVFA